MIRPLIPSVVLFCAAFSVPSVAAPSADSNEHPACHPPQARRAQLLELDPDLTGCRPGEACRQSAREGLLALLQKKGFEMHTWSALASIDGRDNVREHDELVAEIESIANVRGDDAGAWYLAGALASDESAEKFLAKALEIDSDYPWVHLSRGIKALGQDKQQSANSLSRFLQLCPSRLRDTKGYPQRVGGAEHWQAHLPVVEKATLALPDLERIATLPLLWQMQFSSLPVDRHDQLRRQVARQAAEVRKLNRRQNANWWKALVEGYELSGDPQALDAVVAERTTAFPCLRESVTARIEEWVKRFEPEASELQLKAKIVKFDEDDLPRAVADLDQMAASCAGNRTLEAWRFKLLGQDTKASAERLQTVADAYLQSSKSHRSPATEPAELQVARLFSERKVATDRIPALIQQARQHETDWSKVRMPERFRKQMKLASQRSTVDMARLASQAHLRLGQPDAARREAETAADLYRALDSEAHSKHLAALHQNLEPLFQELGLANRLGPMPASPVEQAASRAGSGWQSVSKPLGTFALKDLKGRSWTEADLANQGVLINFWATWCAPCIAELPEVQALHDTLADSEDLTVVTFNTDRNVGRVKPFLDKKSFSFPVILAADFLPLDSNSLPQNWVVDKKSVVRKKSTGFSVDGPGHWRDDALKVLKEVAADE